MGRMFAHGIRFWIAVGTVIISSACRATPTPGTPTSFVTPEITMPGEISKAEATQTIEPAETSVSNLQGSSPYFLLSELFPLTPDRGVWVDIPTYHHEELTRIAHLYRLVFNPAIWQLNRGDSPKGPPYWLSLKYDRQCRITPTVGSDLGPGFTWERSELNFGDITFEKTIFYYMGEYSFAGFCGGDLELFTCYRINFETSPGYCIEQAEEVISTISLIDNPIQQEP